jgi:hypothetical protein
MTKYLILSALVFIAASCSEENSSRKDGEVVSALAAGDETSEELKQEIARIEAEEKKRIADEAANVTSISFDRVKHDFGNIPEDSDNLTEFIVTNTGDKPLIIENVQASCGCTTPKKPEDPIMPGQSDVISVGFHPKPEQKNEIIKTVTVTANTEPRINTLTIRAFVK